MNTKSDEELLGRLVGVNIIITTKERQARKHHKRRINKKWLKRYGTIKYEVQAPVTKSIIRATRTPSYL